MALHIPHSIFHLVQLLYVRPETFGPYYVIVNCDTCALIEILRSAELWLFLDCLIFEGGIDGFFRNVCKDLRCVES